MQHFGGVNDYKNISDNIKKNQANINLRETFENIIIMLFTLLISRVSLINDFAPFGIAMVAACINIKRNRIALIVLGSSIGYLTLIKSLDNFWMYLVILMVLYGLSRIAKDIRKEQGMLLISGVVFVIDVIYSYFIKEYTLNVCLINSLIDFVILLPIMILFTYAISSALKFNTKHIYKSEEIIAISVIIALISAGTYGISIGPLSVMNVFSLTFITIIGYINGITVGAATGVAFGIACGISTDSLMDYTYIYSVYGLASGVFKEGKKLLSMILALTALMIMLIYSEFSLKVSLMEGIIASGIFICIPKKMYIILRKELNFNSKEEEIKQGYFEKVKDIYLKKIGSFSGVLTHMSKVLDELADNDKLSMKHKSVTLVEILASRVCMDCNMHNICWKKEAYLTLSAFEELLQDEEATQGVLPNELERKCIKRTALIRNTREILNNYIISEMKKKRLTEAREILAMQINNMARSVDEIGMEFSSEITFNSDFEKELIEVLNRNNIRYDDLISYKNKNNKDVIKISMDACGGDNSCIKNIIPLIKKVNKKDMAMVQNGCSISPNTGKCTVTLEEKYKYDVITCVKSANPLNENVCGDSYSFSNLSHGKYMMLISDGMGKGARAYKESSAAIELMENFLTSGLSIEVAIETINSIMSMKFEEEEKYTTIDLGTIDLYDGKVELVKIGAVATFIKKRNKVEVLKAKTLPIGVLEKPDIDVVTSDVKNGDLIVMVSDGVLDYDEDNSGKVDWLIEYLSEVKIKDPKKLAKNIIDKAIELGGGEAHDDMTAMVSMVCSAS